MWLVALAACSSNDGIDFPARLSPLEENRAPRPKGGDPVREAFEVVSGGEDGLWWAHGRGFVQAPVGVVWLASRDIDVCVDRREVEEWTVTNDTVPEFDASYTIHNRVQDILTVEYDTTWVHEVQQGTPAQPERVVAQWDKTAGTTFIDLLAGSLELTPTDDPQVTEISMVSHLDAALRDDETIATYLRDYYDDLLDTVHGRPLQEF